MGTYYTNIRYTDTPICDTVVTTTEKWATVLSKRIYCLRKFLYYAIEFSTNIDMFQLKNYILVYYLLYII